MESKKVFAALLGAGLAVVAPATAQAQEAAAAPAAPAAQEAAPAQEMPPQQVTDGGVAAVTEAQSENGVPAQERQGAEDVLRKLMAKRGWNESWDNDKKRFIAVGTATFKSADPAKQKDLQARRRFAAKEAALIAKAKLIQFLRQEMSAEDQIVTPGTDLNKAMNAEIENLLANVARQKEFVASLAEKADRTEAEALRGTSLTQRLDDLIAALIKKLDKEYKADKRDEAAIARHKAALEELKREKAHYEDLVKRANSLRNQIVETQKSSVKSMAAMPVFGSTVMLQTESWDKDGTYQVSVMLAWSNVLERAARAIVTGEKYSVKPNAKNTPIHTWLEKQDLASMVGSRQFIDNKGNRWFLGIAAEPCGRKLHPRTRNINQQRARLFASQEALYGVFADVRAQEAAADMMTVRSAGKDSEGNEEFSEQTAGTFARNMEQKVKGLTIRGGQVLMSKTVVHPITGDEIYVVVYGFNPLSVGPALKAWQRNYATRVQMERHQTVERGRQAAVNDAVKAATNDPKDFKRGYNQQQKSLNRELQSRQPKKGGVRVLDTEAGTSSAPTKSTSGTFGGDSNVSDDF